MGSNAGLTLDFDFDFGRIVAEVFAPTRPKQAELRETTGEAMKPYRKEMRKAFEPLRQELRRRQWCEARSNRPTQRARQRRPAHNTRSRRSRRGASTRTSSRG